jgi:N6-adenosine-specific RNA methylase IME4
MRKQICVHCRKTFTAVRRDAFTCSPACRKARERRLRAITPPLPDLPPGSVELLLIDLPLAWHGFSPKGEGRSPQHHYPTMDIPALCRLAERFRPLIAKNAVAAAWVYGPRQWDLPIVMKAFGFKYSGEGLDEFDWIKIDKTGRPRIVNGKTTRKGKESVTLWKRGNGLKIVNHSVRQVIFAPRGKHSEKPQQIHEALERLYGPHARRLELFGRRARPHWSVWGNQVEE